MPDCRCFLAIGEYLEAMDLLCGSGTLILLPAREAGGESRQKVSATNYRPTKGT
jgi:hypothetical protein